MIREFVHASRESFDGDNVEDAKVIKDLLA